jgi:hypothetical protein
MQKYLNAQRHLLHNKFKELQNKKRLTLLRVSLFFLLISNLSIMET